MTTKRIALMVMGGLLLVLVVLRELGVIDVNLYRSTLSASQTATTAQTTRGEEKHFSYRLALKSKSQTLSSSLHSYNGQTPIEIEAILGEPVYSGNCVLPFAKTFQMTYRCNFKTMEPPGEHEVHGEIKGEITAAIQGLCTRRKARELTFEEAKKQVVSYLEKQLSL